MPGKSGHAKGKHHLHSKKKKGSQKLRVERQYSPATITQQQTITQADEAIPAPTVSAPSASIATAVTKPSTVQHSYIGRELQRIGILAGIMLVILVVLAIFFS